MIKLVLIGVVWALIECVILLFFQGAGILNEQWDRDSDL